MKHQANFQIQSIDWLKITSTEYVSKLSFHFYPFRYLFNDNSVVNFECY